MLKNFQGAGQQLLELLLFLLLPTRARSLQSWRNQVSISLHSFPPTLMMCCKHTKSQLIFEWSHKQQNQQQQEQQQHEQQISNSCRLGSCRWFLWSVSDFDSFFVVVIVVVAYMPYVAFYTAPNCCLVLCWQRNHHRFVFYVSNKSFIAHINRFMGITDPH